MNVNLTFTQEQLSIVNAALMEMPFKIAAPLINDINNQIQKQLDVNEQRQSRDVEKS
tara:strand:+ start:273 stop:443 length:171 start_codon:yes stop_codon:yes gene_type:complete